MTSEMLLNWLFVYVLAGSIIWAMLVAAGLIEEARKEQSVPAIVLASVWVVFAWPLIVAVFIGGLIEGVRQCWWRVRG